MAAQWDIAVIGAGAAGLAAGIFAAQADPSLRVTLLDGAARLGAKILVSGGGRCNVTHERVTPEDFNGPRPVVRSILAEFDHAAAVRWFESLGVPLKREDTGKLFPTSDDAGTVLQALLRRCRELNLTLQTGWRVRDLLPPPTGDQPWVVVGEPGRLTARRVIMATGGRSLPRTGSDGEGWRIVARLGHRVTPTYPALAPLVLAEDFFHRQVAGLSLPVSLRTTAAGRGLDQREGSLLFTHFGVSGPVVMDASRHWLIAAAEGKSPLLLCNLLPGTDFAPAEAWLLQQARAHPRRALASVLGDRLAQRLAEALLRHLGLDPAGPVGQVSREHRRQLVHALTALPLPVLRDRGWNYAEVTAGGVPLAEVDHRGMASRVVPGLHLAGEMLDCDGRIGGFNFQWAWATGWLAGRGAARVLRAEASA